MRASAWRRRSWFMLICCWIWQPREVQALREIQTYSEAPEAADKGALKASGMQANVGNLESLGTTPEPGCKRLMWFLAVDAHGHAANHARRGGHSHWEFTKVALLSAKENAPSLLPHIMYDGEMDDEIAMFAKAHGAVVVNRNLSFIESMKRTVQEGKHDEGWLMAYGTWMRFDVPLVVQELKQQNAIPDDVEQESVLYTDSDVMFLKDVNSCSLKKPTVALMGPEFERGKMANAGVMYLNATAWAEEFPKMVAFAESRHWGFGGNDQEMIQMYFAGRLELLPDEFNWKGYYGFDNGTAAIFHWHGPKPQQCMECFITTDGNPEKLDECFCHISVYKTVAKMTPSGQFNEYVRMMNMYNELHKKVQAWTKHYRQTLPKHDASKVVSI